MSGLRYRQKEKSKHMGKLSGVLLEEVRPSGHWPVSIGVLRAAPVVNHRVAPLGHASGQLNQFTYLPLRCYSIISCG